MALLDLKVNGQEVQVEAPDTGLLLDVLRERLFLTGAKRGCETSHCGCCTVRVDRRAVHSCVVLAARCAGKEITTVEGCGDGMELDRLQQSFLKHGAVQCGYCGPGMLMAAQAAGTQSPADARRSEEGIGRQSLPLHGLHAHLRRHPGLRPR